MTDSDDSSGPLDNGLLGFSTDLVTHFRIKVDESFLIHRAGPQLKKIPKSSILNIFSEGVSYL